MYLIIDQPPPLSIMVFLFFLVSSASFGTGNPGLAESIAETVAVRETRHCRTNSLLACIWPPKPGSGRIWASRRFSPLKRPSAGQITLKRTFLRQNVIWPEKSIVETGTGNPWFAVPDFYPTGLLRADRFGTENPCFSVPSLLYRFRAPALLPRRAGSPSVFAARRHSAG